MIDQSASLRRYQVLVPGFLVTILFGNLYSAISIGSTRWLIIGLILALPIVVPKLGGRFSLSPLIVWSYGFLLLGALGMFQHTDLGNAASTLRQRALFLAVLFGIYFLIANSTILLLVLKTIACITVGSMGVNVYEFFNPGIFSVVTGRSAGLYLNPNSSALALVLGMTLGNQVVPTRYQSLFQLLTGLGVFLTFSRGGLVCWVLAVTMLQFGAVRSRTALRSWGLTALIVLAAAISPLGGMIQERFKSDEAVDTRLIERVVNVGSSETLDDPRIEIVAASVDIAMEKPILGHGTGRPIIDFGGLVPQGTHNMYLSLWIQHGLIGLAVIPLLVLAIMRGQGIDRGLLPFAITLVVASFFSHMLLAQWQYAVAIAVAARAASLPRAKGVPMPHNERSFNSRDEEVGLGSVARMGTFS